MRMALRRAPQLRGARLNPAPDAVYYVSWSETDLAPAFWRRGTGQRLPAQQYLANSY